MCVIETEDVVRGDATYRITLHADPDAMDPHDRDGFGRILSLNRRHGRFDADGVFAALADDPDAVALSYFEHGECKWAVVGELGPFADCPWDSVRLAGCWLPDAVIRDEARHYGGRTRRLHMERRAREACAVYTRWCNGGFVGYTVERITTCECCGRELADPVDACWGIDDPDYARAEALAALPAGA